MLRLVEQRYRKEFKENKEQIQRSLTREVDGVRVEFFWRGRKNPDKNYRVVGTTTGAYMDMNDDLSLKIEFTNPESNGQETTTRYVRELQLESTR